MEIFQIPVLEDNFIYILHESEQTAVVDPALAEPVLDFLRERKWNLDFILNTHHHGDHVGGNRALKKAFPALEVVGACHDSARIPEITREVSEGDEIFIGACKARVFDCTGHTRGHIAYWFPEAAALFCGDTIFSLGCGKLFEGSPQEMWKTLAKLRALPDETLVYCAHEYTLENSRFALWAEPGNFALARRAMEAQALRAEGKFTVPSLLGVEKATNPFLRPESAEIQKHTGTAGKELWEIFGATRTAKDRMDSGITLP